MPDDGTYEGDNGTATAERRGRTLRTRVVTGTAVGALLLGGVALGVGISNGRSSSPAPPITCNSTTPKLTVQGSGQATATPDELVAVLAVNTTGPTAAAALSQDNVEAAAVVTALSNGGVAPKDVQTTGLTLQAQYAYPKGVPKVTGFQVSNTVTATLNENAKAGATIDAVVGAAGNAVTIDSLTFSFRHPQAVEDTARASAVHQAVSHARAMAEAAGRRLGPVCSLTDQTQTPAIFQGFSGTTLGSAAAAAAPTPVPLEAGTQSESDQVTVVYALSNGGK
jgi:hypothetical protein